MVQTSTWRRFHYSKWSLTCQAGCLWRFVLVCTFRLWDRFRLPSGGIWQSGPKCAVDAPSFTPPLIITDPSFDAVCQRVRVY
jgi:hypothetical protein